MAIQLTTVAGDITGFFGTSEGRSLGLVISSHTSDRTAEQATLNDESGNVITLRMYNRRATGSIQGYVIAGGEGQTAEQLATARAALVVGAIFTPPDNQLFGAKQDSAGKYEEGVPIITDVNFSTSNTEFATMTIQYVQHPRIQGTIDDQTLAGS